MAITTNYSWSTPDDTALVKDGASAIRTLGSSVDTTLFTALGGTYPGLRLVKKQTIGTGVSSVAVTDAFSSTYENYKVMVAGGVSSATNTQIVFRVGAKVANYYGGGAYSTWAGAVSSLGSNNAGGWNYIGSASSTGGLQMTADVLSPQLAKFTVINGFYRDNLGAGSTTGVVEDTTQYTGFTILPASGTLTGGTIYVYGYGAS